MSMGPKVARDVVSLAIMTKLVESKDFNVVELNERL